MKIYKFSLLALVVFSSVGIAQEKQVAKCPTGDSTLCIRIEPGGHRILKGEGVIEGEIEHK